MSGESNDRYVNRIYKYIGAVYAIVYTTIIYANDKYYCRRCASFHCTLLVQYSITTFLAPCFVKKVNKELPESSGNYLVEASFNISMCDHIVKTPASLFVCVVYVSIEIVSIKKKNN